MTPNLMPVTCNHRRVLKATKHRIQGIIFYHEVLSEWMFQC